MREIQRERKEEQTHTGLQLDVLFDEEGRYVNELYPLRPWTPGGDIGVKSEAVHPCTGCTGGI
jgi:hypothetical protein